MKYRVGFYAREEIVEADSVEEAEEVYWNTDTCDMETVDYVIPYRKRNRKKK